MTSKGRPATVEPHPAVQLRRASRGPAAVGWCRLLDITLGLAALVVASPALAVSALAIVMDSRGAPIYGATRVGRGGKTFRMYKLRTMVQDAATIGPWFTAPNDPRVTRVGRYLRRTSLDELPQLWNVVRGDMSVVGPRPDTIGQYVALPKDQARLRASIRPGLTGLSQIRGRSSLSAEQRLTYDLELADRYGLALYLSICASSVRPVLARSGTN